MSSLAQENLPIGIYFSIQLALKLLNADGSVIYNIAI